MSTGKKSAKHFERKRKQRRDEAIKRQRQRPVSSLPSGVWWDEAVEGKDLAKMIEDCE